MKVHEHETEHGVVCAYYDCYQRVWKAYFNNIEIDNGRFIGYGMNKVEAVENLIDQWGRK